MSKKEKPRGKRKIISVLKQQDFEFDSADLNRIDRKILSKYSKLVSTIRDIIETEEQNLEEETSSDLEINLGICKVDSNKRVFISKAGFCCGLVRCDDEDLEDFAIYKKKICLKCDKKLK